MPHLYSILELGFSYLYGINKLLKVYKGDTDMNHIEFELEKLEFIDILKRFYLVKLERALVIDENEI